MEFESLKFVSQSRRAVMKTMLSVSAASLMPRVVRAAVKPQGQATTVPPAVESAVRELIARGIAQGETTGLALAVVSGGEIVWEEGFGWANVEKKLRVGPHSAFSLQSVTKPFTATVLATLAAEGKLALDDPANRYLGAHKLQGPNGDPNKVTVRMLGAHCSGLPETYEEVHNGQASPLPDAFLSRYGRLAFPPGRIWEYSNIGFDALGAIASNLTGMDFGKLMASRLLTPLGLRDSFWDTDKARVGEGVTRYDASGNTIPFYLTTTPPSGELFASVHDIARFAIWNMKLPLGGGSLLMNQHWIDELHKPVFTGQTGAVSTFGWGLDRLKSGMTVIHKIGGGAGVSTIVCMVPERGLACIVLANHQHADALTRSISDEILRSYLADWTMPGENGEPARAPFVADAEVAGRWRGTLMNDGVSIPTELHIVASDTATLTIGSGPAEKITDMQSEGPSFVGVAHGIIASPEALRIGADGVRIKLLPHEGKLIGRFTAQAGPLNDPRARLPYVASLSRV